MKRKFEYCITILVILGACKYFTDLWLSILFIFFHEAAHYITGRILGLHFKGAQALPFGIRFGFKEEFINPRKDILISISGPLINFLFFIFFLWLNKYCSNFEICRNINLMLFIFNLLPISFLDGGRIFKALISISIGFYYSHLYPNLNGICFGIFILIITIVSHVTIKKIPLIIMGIFFIYKGFLNLKNITINVINDLLYKKSYYKDNTSYLVVMKTYNAKTKLLDIIKKFCFNKYYIIYIMDNGNLSYNINENDLIKLYCTYGNIILGECAMHINSQEV